MRARTFRRPALMAARAFSVVSTAAAAAARAVTAAEEPGTAEAMGAAITTLVSAVAAVRRPQEDWVAHQAMVLPQEQLDPLFAAYAAGHKRGERFSEFVIRAGIVAATGNGRDFHENTGPR